VFRRHNRFPHLTVIDNITVTPAKVLRHRRAVAEADATAVLERVGSGGPTAERGRRLASLARNEVLG
jgi:ABC-type polar amino acid transport system ATPase subunit